MNAYIKMGEEIWQCYGTASCFLARLPWCQFGCLQSNWVNWRQSMLWV